MKRLLIATDSLFPRLDGVSVFLNEVILYLSKKFSVTVIAPHYGGEQYLMPGVRIIRIPLLKLKIGGYKPAKPQLRIVKEAVRNSDIIFIHSIGPIGAAAIIEADKQKKKIFSYIHSIEWELWSEAVSTLFFKKPINALTKKIAKFLYNKCDILMVSSKSTMKSLELNEIKTKKIVVPIGLDTKRFIPPLKKSAIKRKLGLDNKFVITYCGRLNKEKDLSTLLKAFKIIRKDFKNVILMIVGDGDQRKIFKNQRNIRLIGFVRDVVPYLQASDIFVLPSLTETSSLATLEAMSTGLAVISTPVGYVKDYITNGYNGYLFPRKDSNYLYDVLKLLIKERKVREKLGRHARAYVKNRFSWEKTAKLIIKSLQK